MARHVPLDPAAHAHLSVRRDRAAGLGDAVMSAPAFPHEFRQIQAHYPIVFSREGEAGRIRPYALFGLERGSNLFLAENGWDAPYIPVAHRMKPFLIGRSGTGLKVHIDLDDPRVSDRDGEALFQAGGAATAFLEEVSALLGEVHEAEQSLVGFSAMLDDLDLVEPFTLDITLDHGQQGRLAGFHAIAEARLDRLDGEALARLQAAGFLQALYMAVASMSQFVNLIARRNQLDRVAI